MKNTFLQFLCIASVSLSLSHCTALHSVSLTQVPVERSNVIEAETSKLVFLAFNFNNDYVNELEEELRSKCPNGKVQGILTKYTTKFYLLFVDHIISAKAFCVKDGK